MARVSQGSIRKCPYPGETQGPRAAQGFTRHIPGMSQDASGIPRDMFGLLRDALECPWNVPRNTQGFSKKVAYPGGL